MRKEMMISSSESRLAPPEPGSVVLRTLVSERCGAVGFCTAIATFGPGACLPYHMHDVSEAITALEGPIAIRVQGRRYILNSFDCIHLPAKTPHRVENESREHAALVHSSFASPKPARMLVQDSFAASILGRSPSDTKPPEMLVRFEDAAIYELSNNAFFRDLFAGRLGSKGICGGHGRFLPGSSLECHTHDFDESITIVKGTAVCLARGQRYELSDFDTAFVPRGVPHRFINESTDDMAMLWVYAGTEPDRQIVNPKLCSGEALQLQTDNP